MRNKSIKRVIIEKGTEELSLSKRIINNLEGLPFKYQESSKERKRDNKRFLDLDKDTLHLVSFKGELLKPCPGTKEYICCGYQILNVGTNCPLDCSYCILQAYFNQPSLRVFANLEENLSSIMKNVDDHPENIFRIGTGEFTDSLAINEVTEWSDILIPYFSKRKNVVLELKTKTVEIERLLSLPYRDRIIVSWSLNSSYITSREEHGAPSIEKRLIAAKRLQSEGYTLGFHFDPLIYHQDWKDEYKKTIEMIDHYIDPKGIIWISMGCIRFMPNLKNIIRKRHLNTKILDGEFILGLDGKMRYFKPIRMEMYSFMAELINKWHKDNGLYLCMESDEIWANSLGWTPKTNDGLSEYLDKRVKMIFD